jgi:uncharacterized protein
MPDLSSRYADRMQPDGCVKRAAHCTECNALCCRLIVVLGPDDNIPGHLTTHLPNGSRVMAHAEDGWCIAMDRSRMNCSIYESRPADCRRFAMGGAYCNAIRSEYTAQRSRSIDIILK